MKRRINKWYLPKRWPLPLSWLKLVVRRLKIEYACVGSHPWSATPGMTGSNLFWPVWIILVSGQSFFLSFFPLPKHSINLIADLIDGQIACGCVRTQTYTLASSTRWRCACTVTFVYFCPTLVRHLINWPPGATFCYFVSWILHSLFCCSFWFRFHAYMPSLANASSSRLGSFHTRHHYVWVHSPTGSKLIPFCSRKE